MSRPEDFGCLDDRQWGELQSLMSRVEEGWRDGPPAGNGIQLTDRLPPAGTPQRKVFLHELIKTELEIRWRYGRPAYLDEYLARYPELGSLADLPARLIFEEFRARRRYGDRPALETYRERFPAQFDQLQGLFEESSVQPMSGNQQPPGPPAGPYKVGDVVGDCTLRELLGVGGFAYVWKAEAKGGVPVAVKILKTTESTQKELASLEKTKGLRHPYLLQVHRFWMDAHGRLVIVMDLAAGTLSGLAKAYRDQGLPGLPRDKLLKYIKESAEGLDYLHNNPVYKLVHRDIKPDNILYQEGHAKVADFGLAKEWTAEEMRSSRDHQSVVGTFPYMAWEACATEEDEESGRKKAGETPASDQFSLAVTYAELRLGRRLRPQGQKTTWVPIYHGDLKPDLSGLSAAERPVLTRALSRDPAQRYKTCTDLANALEQAYARELAEAARPQGVLARAWGKFRGTAEPSGLVSRPPTGAPPAVLTDPGPESAAPAGASADVADKSSPHFGTVLSPQGETPASGSPAVDFAVQPPHHRPTPTPSSGGAGAARQTPTPSRLFRPDTHDPGAGRNGGVVSKAPTITTALAAPADAVSGQTVTLTATVAAEAPGARRPTGAVTFHAGSVSSANVIARETLNRDGKATATTNALGTGTHTIVAVYGGDNGFAASQAATSQVVGRASTATALRASPAAVALGQTLTLTAEVSATAPGGGVPTGTVTFADAAGALGTGTLDETGIATFATAALGLGQHALTATYDGDDDYRDSDPATAVAVSVLKGTTTTVASSSAAASYGQPVTLTATVRALPPASGMAETGGTVTFFDGDALLGTEALDAGGVAALTASALDGGQHRITARYAGAGDFLGSTSPDFTQTIKPAATTTVLHASARRAVRGRTLTFTARVTADEPVPVPPVGKVTFYDALQPQYVLGKIDLDTNGTAVLSTKDLASGEHDITAAYSGQGNFAASQASVPVVVRSVWPAVVAGAAGVVVLGAGVGGAAWLITHPNTPVAVTSGLTRASDPTSKIETPRVIPPKPQLAALLKTASDPADQARAALASARVYARRHDWGKLDELAGQPWANALGRPEDKDCWKALDFLRRAHSNREAYSEDLLDRVSALRQFAEASSPSYAWERQEIWSVAYRILDDLVARLEEMPSESVAQEADRLEAARLPARLGGYPLYTRALALEADNRRAAADKLLAALTAQLDHPVPQGLESQRRASRTLTDAAVSLRITGHLDQPFAKEPTPGADKAYEWLRAARGLLLAGKSPEPLPLRVNLALAAWHRTEPDADLVLELTGPLLGGGPEPKELGADVCLLLLVQAKAWAHKDNSKAALASYERLLPLITAKGIGNQFSPPDWDSAVLRPATLLTRDAGSNQQVARFYAARARLIEQSPHLNWGGDPDKEVYKAYGEAVRLDPADAEYCLGKIYAALRLPRPNVDELEKEAGRVIALDADKPKEPRGHALLGRILLEGSRAPGLTTEVRVQRLRESAKASGKAVERCPAAREEALSLFLLNLSQALLEQGNYDVSERRKCLEGARQAADRATKLLNVDYPEYAWEALGNVLEDFAWLLKDDPPEHYKQAVAAFTRAIDWSDDRPQPWVARGRCHFRWGEVPGQDRKLLDSACQDLTNALKRKPRAAEEAQACYWRAKVYAFPWRGRDFARACVDFDRVLALQKEAPEWTESALRDKALLCLDEAELAFAGDPAGAKRLVGMARDLEKRLRNTQGVEADQIVARAYDTEAQAALDRARALKTGAAFEAALDEANGLADKLQGYDRAAAARVRALAFDMRGELEKAIEACNEVLPENVAQAKPEHDRLLMVRGFLYGTKLDTRDKSLRDFDRAAELATHPRTRASAFGGGGLTRLTAANLPGTPAAQQPKYRARAIEDLRQAVEAWPENPQGWFYRWKLGAELKVLGANEPDAERQKSIRKEAREHLEAAENGATDEVARRRIRSTLAELNDGP